MTRRRVPKRDQKSWLAAYHSEERVRWIAAQPCAVCGAAPSENAHTGKGGVGRKASHESIVPLCFQCHHDLHTRGRVTCERTWGIELAPLARRTANLWRRYADPEDRL